MELYSMPQLDKTSSTYSDIHYVERSNLPNTSIPVEPKKFSPVSGDILTSSAWSAVIHRPAEDSEPEDLPSTVDMDAIKGSPSTSLPTTGPLAWSESDRGQDGAAGGDSESGDDEDDDDDDDDDDDEDDEDNDKEDSSSDNESSSPNSDCEDADSESGTAKGSASDSDSESSSRNSYDSDSDSASSDSSCSSQSSESSNSSSSPTPKPFLGRENDKHATLQKQQESSVSSLMVGSKLRMPSLTNNQNVDKKDVGNSSSLSKEEENRNDKRGMVKSDNEKPLRKDALAHHSNEEQQIGDKNWQERQGSVRNPARSRVEMSEGRVREKLREMTPKPSPSKGILRKDSDITFNRTFNKSKAGDEVTSTRPSVGLVSTSATANSQRLKNDYRSSKESKSDHKASILSSTSQTASSSVNSASVDSSSDVELPDQVVSDAIKRIHVDSGVKSRPGAEEEDDNDEDDEDDDSSDDASSRGAHYSSSLLQKFVESTERLSGKRNLLLGRASESKHSSSSGISHSQKEASRRKRVRPTQVPSKTAASVRHPEASSGSSVRTGPADLEVYCSVSNVSPDSGIYCVNGSPWHQSSPAHSPQHPPQQLPKTLPSPPHGFNIQNQRRKHASLKGVPSSSSKSPKKSSNLLERHGDRRVPPINPIQDSEEETASSSPLLSAPARRGPGRPKKAPPVLELCLPHHSKDSAKRKFGLDRSQNKNRKRNIRKESESSDQSVERCDKILAYSTHRSRGEVQMTSQGVQCDQSEFPQLGQLKSKKKKKNQDSQVSPTKSNNLFKSSSSGQRREKSHQKIDNSTNNCDRIKKSVTKCDFGQGSNRQLKSSCSDNSTKDSGFMKRTSHVKRDSPSQISNQSSKRRLAAVEKQIKAKRKEDAERLAAAAAALLSKAAKTSSQQANATSPLRPSKSLQRPTERVVSLPRGLKHKTHKHNKKHRKERNSKRSKKHSRIIDPTFLQELEKLIADFQGCCIAEIRLPVNRFGEGSSAARLPSLFRLKRIVKKRKGSERSRNSDRDSGPEADIPKSSVASTSRDVREKGSTGGKRRPKKSAIETPKGQRPEANNEQRLPLKKRHYHMSAAPNQQSGLTSSPEMSLDISSSAEDKRSNNDESPTSSISSKSSTGSCTMPLSAKAIAPVSNMSSKASLGNVSSIKENPLPAATNKVTIVMPATSSNSPSEFPVQVPSILSKADSSASFASVCGKSDAITPVPSVEKTVMLSTSAAVTSSEYSNRVCSVPSLCDRNSSQSSNSSMNVKSAVPRGCNEVDSKLLSTNECAQVNKVNTSSASSSKASVSKTMLTPVLKQVAGNNSNIMAVKTVADSSLVIKTTIPTSVFNPPQAECPSSSNGSNLIVLSSDANSKSTAVTSVSGPTIGSTTTTSAKNSIVPPPAEGIMVKNSYDEAIEACISKYSSDVCSLNPAPRSVITTPKKRHRMEMQGKPSSGKGKDLEAGVHSTTSTTGQAAKKSNSRSSSSVLSLAANAPEITQPLVQTKLSPTLPTPQALSPGGSKLPESGIFEPSSSSEHYVVNVSLPETPVKSVIAGLSKLKGAASAKPTSTSPMIVETSSKSLSIPQDSYAITCHNLRHKKSMLSLSSEEDPHSQTEAMTPKEKPKVPSDTLSEADSAVKVESELKTNAKLKPKLKPGSDADKSISVGETGSSVKSQETSTDIKHNVSELPTSKDLKEVEINVEKLSNSQIVQYQSGKDKLTKQSKNCSSVPKRRRKCNRTGFPVKRKRKKKEASHCDLPKPEEMTKHDESEVLAGSGSLKTDKISLSNPETCEQRSSSRVQLRKELVNHKSNVNSAGPDSSGESTIDLKVELSEDDLHVIKVEQKEENQSVILKGEDCVPNGRDARDIKQEGKVQEPAVASSQNSSFLPEVKSNVQSFTLKSGESSVTVTEDVPHVPYIDRIPNKEKYMFAGFTKRLDSKPKSVRNPSKAVIRAMRAKFSENIPLPEVSSGNIKGSKVMPCSWSSDESEDSVDQPDLPEILPVMDTEVAETLPKLENVEVVSKLELPPATSKSRKNSSRKRTRRDRKRQANSSSDEPIKNKCAKSGKEASQSTMSKAKPSTSDSRTRNKRKSEVEDLPSSADLRNARCKKRLRTVQRMEAENQETDCDESVGDLPASCSGPVGDAVSEDEASKVDLKDAKLPRWRKKYLPAGLLSDYFKQDEPRPVNDSKKGLQYKPDDHPHGLLPPPFHCGKWLRQRKINFQLPYDLWWLHTHNKLPGRDIVPSWNYKKIRTNVYYNVKPSYVHEPQACDCKMPDDGSKGCGDDCLNRLVYTECSPALCPLRDICSNQKIQRHEWAPGLDRFMTKEKGWGVRTKQSIKSGEFILEYVGEVVSDREFKERMASIYTQDTHHYCLHLDGGLVIDGHRMGGDGRFVNHSCEPNCEMQKWSVNGLFRMALFALRDIDPFEELGYDYNFSLFNASEGQQCKCGSSNCRGVIGGKSQRVNALPLAQNSSSSKVSIEDCSDKKGSRKNKRKTCRKNDGERAAENMRQRKRMEAQRLSQLIALNMRQMSHQQRCFVQQHHCFMLRNLEKVRRLKEKLWQTPQATEGCTRPAPSNVKQSDVFLTQLNALSTPRNVRTRRLAQAEDNPELARNARLACVLRDLYNAVVSAKDEKGDILSVPFMTLPNKRKLPLYYVRIREPLDFSTIEQKINSGLYSTLEAFDQDVCKVLNNNLRFYGRTTNFGIASVRLKKVYLDAKKEAHPQFVDVLGEALPASFVAEKNPAEEEDVIRCICGLYRDEGMMIQCERCLVWQHCDCVRADSTFEHYLCEICQPRPVDLEIIMDPQPNYTSEGQTEYVTLLRSDLQIRQGDTVYVLRDVTEGEGESQTKVTYKTIKDPKYGDMDIFRIERLWKDEKGDRFAFGHHYLRPHETYHEPTRKFYPNEVMRVPLYEIIPLDLIWARCWVLDPMTYCKGRPIEAVEEHVYICEYRVDKKAHLFYKISKSQSRANLCLKSYAFEIFETRLKPVRTYTPHGPVPPLKPRIRGYQDDASSTKSMQQSTVVDEEEEEVPLARVRDTAIAEKREKQRSHLNRILLRLLANQQCKQPLDMSYLLDPGRRHRKKPSSLNT